MTKQNQPQQLGNILQKLIDRQGYRERIDGVRAVEAWAFVAGPKINGVTERVWSKDRKLYVQLRSAPWRQQLHLQRRDWLKRLNGELGSDVIDEIVFR
jgi:predicted nucleic acid-binding Zn ribbon protein